VLEDGLKEEALQQEMQDAEFQLKKDAKVLHDVRYKLKNAPSTMKASERSKLVLHVKLLSSQHEQQKRHIESLQQQILVLQIGNSGSIGTSQLRVAKDRLDKAVVDVQMKKAAFKVAQSAARANPNDDKVRAEALKIEGLLLRAKSQELNAEKHIAWVKRTSSGFGSHAPAQPLTVTVSRPFVEEDPLQALKGNAEKQWAVEKLQKKFEKAKFDLNDSIHSQKRAKDKVNELIQKQQVADKGMKHKVGTSRTITEAEMASVDAAKRSFYWKTIVQDYKARITALRHQKDPIKLKMVVPGTTPAGSPIEAAIRKAGEELQAHDMIPVPMISQYWLPTKSRCHQAFAFVTGTCNKGPYVTVKCEIGNANVRRTIPVQSGCSCNHQFIHKLMIGNLERRTNINEMGRDECLAEFDQNVQSVRERFFDYTDLQRCSLMIDNRCRALQAQQPQPRPPTAKETEDALEKQKSGLIENSINAYTLSTSQAQKRIAKLQKQLSSPNLRNKVFKFAKIPGMALKANAEEIEAEANVCRENCLNQRKCLSYSVNDKLEKCWLSATKLTYDDNYSSYIKINEHENTPNSFNAIPGMKIQTLDRRAQGTETTTTDTTLDMCRSTCLDSDKCKSLSYSQVTKTCITSGATIEYDSGADYYEKLEAVPFDPGPFDKRVATERKVKMEAQLELLDGLVKQRTNLEELSIKKLSFQQQMPQALAAERDSKARQKEFNPVKITVPFAPNP